MYCTRCGADVIQGDKFCIKCGAKIDSAGSEVDHQKQGKFFWPRKKALLLILASVVLSSVFWVFVWGTDIYSTEDEAVNILVHLFETVGRQEDAWEKTELSIDMLYYALSDECVSSPGCVDESLDIISTLWAEAEKEKEEIGNLWSKEILGQDLESYFSKLDEKNLGKIWDVLNIYFPEESEELGPSESLL